MLKIRRVIVAKIETTEGVAETLAAADGGILAINPTVDENPETIKRDGIVSASMSQFSDLTGKKPAKLTFSVEIKGAGAAYSASVKPALSPYLRACGFAETITTTVGLEKASYQPASTGLPSLTMACYEDGMIKKLIGCRGKVKFSAQSGGIVKADFEFMGVRDSVIDGSLLAPTYESTIPPVLLNTPVTLDSYTPKIQGFGIDVNNPISVMEDITKAQGLYAAVITGTREVTGTLDPEMALVAAYDFHGKRDSKSAIALTIGKIGNVQYNRFKFTAPKMTINAVNDGERNGVAVAELTVKYGRNAGDDEIVLEFD